jgi:peptidoglycan/xylan/chitin deacetylase (PgdA/CDA1 family)
VAYLKKEKYSIYIIYFNGICWKKWLYELEQIKEIEKSGLGIIGNHSHTHEYLVDKTNNQIINDLNQAIALFEKELGHSPAIFLILLENTVMILKKF